MAGFRLHINFLWEADRVAPSRWPGHPDLRKPLEETPDGRLQIAGNDAANALVADSGLCARLRETGLQEARVFVSVVGDDSEAPDGRVTYRRRGTHLLVNSWFHDDPSQETPEAFQTWIREKIRGSLESWLRKKRKPVA